MKLSGDHAVEDMNMRIRPLLLVVDDEPAICALVERFARGEGFDVVTRPGGVALTEELPRLKPDVALIDKNMPELGGLDILRAVAAVHPACQVVLMTGDATLDTAIEAVKLGARDYVTKPLDFERLRGLLATVRSDIERRQAVLAADTMVAAQSEFCGMVGRSAVMEELFDLVRRLAPHARSALITGETGTGKELIAAAFHKMGPRRARKFIPFNCSAVVETLFESELFGHARGAFTGAVDAKPGLFEVADGGTLFLDEVGELSLPVQAKLLRVLENGEVQRVGATERKRVDIRVVAATNRSLEAEVGAGRFRQDLFYRLNVIEIHVPPLRARRDDIPYLTAAFVAEFSARFGKSLTEVSLGAKRLLHDAPWPGNIRELRNVLERACMLSEGRVLTEREVLAALGSSRPPAEGVVATSRPVAVAAPSLDRGTIEHALQGVGGNMTAAAKHLGVSRRALYRRLDGLGLR
jgi:DNA-binding NtrC family response regulator